MNVFRPTYRTLSFEEKQYVDAVKNSAEALYTLLESIPDPRAKALARTKLEECVMWAVKGITG
jgi:hypothetical protein